MAERKYFVRFDDICPTMDYNQFQRAKTLMDKYGIKPLLGIIPENKDEDQMKCAEDPDFWAEMRDLQSRGWAMALHGCNHIYNNENPKTMVCGRKHSEFAGNDYITQYETIKRGKEILENHGINTDIFFAPAHTYDKITLKALAANGLKYNIDGLSSKPYKQCGIINIPCRYNGIPRKISGEVVIAVNHSSEWSREDKAEQYDLLERFCAEHADEISDFGHIEKIGCGSFMVQKISEKLFKAKMKLREHIGKIYRGLRRR